MRRLVWFTVLAFALAVPAVGFAVVAGSDDGTLSVKAGVGKVTLNFNGSAVGRLQKGSIQVTDPVASDGVGFDFWGCEKEIDKSDSTTLCRGSNLRFRAIGGKYQIQIKGSGMYLSAVGHGQATLDGRGDEANIDSDGFYSLNDQPYRSLPDFGQIYTLAAPAGGG
jgi:hypothetical protein